MSIQNDCNRLMTKIEQKPEIVKCDTYSARRVNATSYLSQNVRINYDPDMKSSYSGSGAWLFGCQLISLTLFILLTINVPTTSSSAGSAILVSAIFCKQLILELIRGVALALAGIFTLLAVKQEIRKILATCGLKASGFLSSKDTRRESSVGIKQWLHFIICLCIVFITVAVAVPISSLIISDNITTSGFLDLSWKAIVRFSSSAGKKTWEIYRYLSLVWQGQCAAAIRQVQLLATSLIETTLSSLDTPLSEDIKWHAWNVKKFYQNILQSDAAATMRGVLKQFAYYFFILGEQIVPIKPYTIAWSQVAIRISTSFVRNHFCGLNFLSPHVIRAFLATGGCIIPTAVLMVRKPIHYFCSAYNIDVWAVCGLISTAIYVTSYFTLELIKDISAKLLSDVEVKWPHLIRPGANITELFPPRARSAHELQLVVAIVTSILICVFPPSGHNKTRQKSVSVEGVFAKDFDIGSNDVLGATCPTSEITEPADDHMATEEEDTMRHQRHSRYSSSSHEQLSCRQMAMPEINEGNETDSPAMSGSGGGENNNQSDQEEKGSARTSIDDEDRRAQVQLDQVQSEKVQLDCSQDDSELICSSEGSSCDDSSSSCSSQISESAPQTERREAAGTRICGPDIPPGRFRSMGGSHVWKRSATVSDYSTGPPIMQVDGDQYRLHRTATDSAKTGYEKSSDLLPMRATYQTVHRGHNSTQHPESKPTTAHQPFRLRHSSTGDGFVAPSDHDRKTGLTKPKSLKQPRLSSNTFTKVPRNFTNMGTTTADCSHAENCRPELNSLS